jgi:hypothetical protein
LPGAKAPEVSAARAWEPVIAAAAAHAIITVLKFVISFPWGRRVGRDVKGCSAWPITRPSSMLLGRIAAFLQMNNDAGKAIVLFLFPSPSEKVMNRPWTF